MSSTLEAILERESAAEALPVVVEGEERQCSQDPNIDVLLLSCLIHATDERCSLPQTLGRSRICSRRGLPSGGDGWMIIVPANLGTRIWTDDSLFASSNGFGGDNN